MADKEIVLIAILRHEGRARIVCVGCTEILHEQGIVRIVGKAPISEFGPPTGLITAFYEIEPPFTLAECRAAIAGRHIGEAWGE